MPKPLLPLFVAIACLCAGSPAQALLQVRYNGTATLFFHTSNGQGYGDAVTGIRSFNAIFYYDDLGNQLAATLRVDGIVRAHDTFCPGGGFGYCPPLSIGPTAIGSGTGTTPEDYISVGVQSPGGFGGVPLTDSLPRRYDLVSGDDSSASLSWALFDNATGFAYNEGSGSVASIGLAVPEPSSWAIMLTGLGLTGLRMRRRRMAAG